ncbi:DUF1638 domain-containing protein [Oscillospiraceae bacterium PP1C4]
MRLAVISCAIFTRMLSRAVADCPNSCRLFFLEQGLHNTPILLREKIQQCIDEVEVHNRSVSKTQQFDAILLAYGLCSNGICGVRAGDIPLIIPRTDDCIGIFLGSQSRYLDYFYKIGGVYWFNSAWYEQAVLPSKSRLDELFEQYNTQYGEDSAGYLIETELDSLHRYRNAVFIRDPFDYDEHIRNAKQAASDFGWGYHEVNGDSSMISRLLEGEWGSKEFLFVPPNQSIVPTYDDLKISAQP